VPQAALVILEIAAAAAAVAAAQSSRKHSWQKPAGKCYGLAYEEPEAPAYLPLHKPKTSDESR